MGKAYLGALLAVLLVAASAAADAAAPRQQPRLAADEIRHELGPVPEGKLAIYVFEIRNEGSASLVIEKLQTS